MSCCGFFFSHPPKNCLGSRDISPFQISQGSERFQIGTWIQCLKKTVFGSSSKVRKGAGAALKKNQIVSCIISLAFCRCQTALYCFLRPRYHWYIPGFCINLRVPIKSRLRCVDGDCFSNILHKIA